MPKFPVDAPKAKVLKAFETLGFSLAREGNHLALERENEDGTKTPLTMPNHRLLKGPTLRAILTQVGVAAKRRGLSAFRGGQSALRTGEAA